LCYNRNMNDLEFVQRCVTGDKLAWDEFLKQYSRLIFNYIHNVLNIKGCSFTEEHVNDIFQEIFHLLIKDDFNKLKSFKAKNGCSLASWLRQVTINFTIDYLRKIKPEISLDEEKDQERSLKDILPDDSELIPDSLITQEKLLELKDCIQKLDTDEKYLLELHIERGLKLEAIRAHLKLSRGAIDMQKARILHKLRECFKNKGFMLDY
jgi:RNA polymerase sigma factor (sigma-70 family)